jgi:hypothetical protein
MDLSLILQDKTFNEDHGQQTTLTIYANHPHLLAGPSISGYLMPTQRCATHRWSKIVYRMPFFVVAY